MKPIKFFALVFSVFVLIQASCATAATKKPVRIARLPIIIQSNKLDYETAVELEMKIARATNVPLNKTLQVAEYIATKESTVELNKIWQTLHAQNRHVKVSEAVKFLASNLNADLVICPILRRYSQTTIQGIYFSSDTRLSSNVATEMIIYDRRTDKLVDKKTSRSYNDSYNRFGTASQLANQCFDELIKSTELMKTIRAIGK